MTVLRNPPTCCRMGPKVSLNCATTPSIAVRNGSTSLYAQMKPATSAAMAPATSITGGETPARPILTMDRALDSLPTAVSMIIEPLSTMKPAARPATTDVISVMWSERNWMPLAASSVASVCSGLSFSARSAWALMRSSEALRASSMSPLIAR